MQEAKGYITTVEGRRSFNHFRENVLYSDDARYFTHRNFEKFLKTRGIETVAKAFFMDEKRRARLDAEYALLCYVSWVNDDAEVDYDAE